MKTNYLALDKDKVTRLREERTWNLPSGFGGENRGSSRWGSDGIWLNWMESLENRRASEMPADHKPMVGSNLCKCQEKVEEMF